VLDYFSGATQVGLTATPKETADVSTTYYFGKPVYTYSLKQGIEDGFLAPYKVVRIDLDKDVAGWRPEKGKKDEHGEEIEDRVYNQRDFDRTMVLEKRTEFVAKKVSQFLAETSRYDKTIVFCEDTRRRTLQPSSTTSAGRRTSCRARRCSRTPSRRPSRAAEPGPSRSRARASRLPELPPHAAPQDSAAHAPAARRPPRRRAAGRRLALTALSLQVFGVAPRARRDLTERPRCAWRCDRRSLSSRTRPR
jgi:hypothetical protein